MRIVFVTSNFPSLARPFCGTFVQQFVWAMARHGHDCRVIAPTSVWDFRYGRLPPLVIQEDVGPGRTVEVRRPRFFSFSSLKIGPSHTGRWSNAVFTQTALSEIRAFAWYPDLVYGHFLYPSGWAAVRAGRAAGIPSVVGVGEGEFWTLNPVGLQRATAEMHCATAFLAVSTPIAGGLKSELGVAPEKIGVFPNGVDLTRFRPARNREAQCQQLGIPLGHFTIGYVGPLTEKKGYRRLMEAVEGLKGVQMILLGKGTMPKADPKIAFCGAVPHEMVAEYLGACHIFVLPTSVEGSCNAVIEAMACGLPIVTSKGAHMDDLVDDSVAIRVDPEDASAIREAITTLRDDRKRRDEMSLACLRRAGRFEIGDRARRVGDWMQGIVEHFALGGP